MWSSNGKQVYTVEHYLPQELLISYVCALLCPCKSSALSPFLDLAIFWHSFKSFGCRFLSIAVFVPCAMRKVIWLNVMSSGCGWGASHHAAGKLLLGSSE